MIKGNSIIAAGYQTTVVNTSGSAQYFSWLPPFGRTLAAGEEASYSGTVHDWLQGRQKLAASLNYAIENNLVEIKSSPVPILYDATSEVSKELKVDDDTLYLAQPAHVNDATPPADILVGPSS